MQNQKPDENRDKIIAGARARLGLDERRGADALIVLGAQVVKDARFMTVHGSTKNHLENILPMLLDREINRTCTAFDTAFSPLTALFDQSVPPDLMLSLIPIILAPFLLWAGYRDAGIVRFYRRRLEIVSDFCTKRDFNIYAAPGVYRGVPRPFRDRLVIKPELYPDGEYRLPLIYDLYAYRAMYPEADMEERQRIGAALDYVLSKEYQAFTPGYGLLYAGPSHYYAMGWDALLPTLQGGLSARALHRLELLSGLPCARASQWCSEALALLMDARGEDGSFRLPKETLGDTDSYWVTGARMSLGENRRQKDSLTQNGTYRAYRILKAYE